MLVTADAIHCQTATARLVREGRGPLPVGPQGPPARD